MGCVASRIDKEERVRICKERIKLMKQLLGYRKEFSDAQVAYLRSLRNTGVTLRQFTESESLELEETTSNIGFPPSPPPPPPLPPSPPPPPTFSPDLRKFEDKPNEAQSAVEEIIETDEESGNTPPPPIPTSSLEYWDPFGFGLQQCDGNIEMEEEVAVEEEEYWADTNSEFLAEDEGSVFGADGQVNLTIPMKQGTGVEIVDDNSSMMSSADMAMVLWRSKKTLARVVKDLDEYFLKASAVVKDIAVFIDIEAGGTFVYQSNNENKRKRSSSAKVFSALTWSWSSRSLQSTKEIGNAHGSDEPCKPGAHCITLQKLYSEEQKLYKDVKEEEMSKVEYGRKSLLVQRQEEEHDWTKAEKTRSTCESLESYILSLQESFGKSSSTILTLINKELHPQLITLASGLMHMWQTMHSCHQVQNHISQQINHLTGQQNVEPTTESHQQAAAQLQTEVTSWYHSFCKLVKFQREYVRVLRKWSQLTYYLEDIDSPQNGKLSTVHTLTKKWQQALDNLPDKMVSEAIKCLVSAVHSIVVQQQEECNMRKRSERLGRKLERELALLLEVEMKFAGSSSLEDANSVVLTSNHPLTIRRAKAEALRILVEDEKVKYTSSMKRTRSMILNNLQTSLPKVFEALTVFSGAYAHGFEEILSNVTVSECEDVQAPT